MKIIGLKILIVAHLACILTASPTYAEEQKQTDKMSNIYKLIDITGSVKSAEVFLETTFEDHYNQLKQSQPKMSDQMSDQMIKILREESIAVAKDSIRKGEYAAKVASVWDKYYTESEIAELLKFWGSSLGKKVAAINPEMTKALLAAGDEWKEGLDREFKARVQRRMLRENLSTW